MKMTNESQRRELAISWSANIYGVHWASVAWSEERQQWCIEDCEGHSLTDAASIRGAAKSKEEAISLAEAMILDGRIPTPQEAWAQAQERHTKARAEAERKDTEARAEAMVRNGSSASLEEARTVLARFKEEKEARRKADWEEWSFLFGDGAASDDEPER
jgi:hypothetical protein